MKPTDASQQVSIIALIRGPARSWVTFQHGNVRYLNAGTFHKGVRMLPENWVLLLVGVKPKKPNQDKKRGRRKDLLLLAASKKNTRDLSQSSVPLNSKMEKILS